MRPLYKGLILSGVLLLIFYVVIIGVFVLFGDIGANGISLTSSTIGVIEIKGVITESRNIIEKIIEFRESSRISAIILRIDSPGGAVGPSQEIFTEILRTARTTDKPVVASMGTTCASGGYYIAAACTKIVANPGTLTGSIGVIMEFMNVEGLFKWVGLGNTIIKSVPFKDVGSYSRPMTTKEKELLQAVVDDVHSQFIDAIAQGRGLAREQVAQFADGRLFTGAQALEINLVDELGNFEDAVAVTAKLANLGDNINIYWPKSRKTSYLDLFFDDIGSKVSESIINLISDYKPKLFYK